MEELGSMVIPIIENEYWYGGFVFGAESMPAGKGQIFDLRTNGTPNQAAPLLLSSMGRHIWAEKGFLAEIGNEGIKVEGNAVLVDGCLDLRGAYLDAMKRYYPFNEIKLDKAFFETPVYNTWIELTFHQNEQDILDYASQIIMNNMPPGILMIDDIWSDYYGKWTFNKERFPDAKEMLKKLHRMGFKVMLWVCPYITPDTVTYREALERGFLIMENQEEPLILKWWNGYSAALDLSNPQAAVWLDEQLEALRAIGVDGFKFDAGDSMYYQENQLTMGNASPDEMSRLWCLYGEKYGLNEYRAGWRTGGLSLMQRLCDKPHSWGNQGIRALIPDILAQGILGMPFGSPDMIGGGEYLNFQENSESLDEELFVRHSEIACMMPVMQFSAAPWRVLHKENFEKIMKSIQIRNENLPYLLSCIEDAMRSGEPAIRYMEYEFPHQGMEKVTDQFMLGSKLLIAPVYEKGKCGREVVVPRGIWEQEGKVTASHGEKQFFNTEQGIPVMLWKKEGECDDRR